MKPYLLFVFCLLLGTQNVVAQGYIFDETIDTTTALTATHRSRDLTLLPKSVTLKLNCPQPEDQGTTPACVFWASTYAAFTIAQSTQKHLKMMLSPYYLFNRLSKTDATCAKQGASISKVLNLLKSEGTASYKDYPQTYKDTILPQPIKTYYKIANATTLYKINSADKNDKSKLIAAIQNSLSNKIPVIIGLATNQQFREFKGKDIWERHNTSAKPLYHAVCIIGYDEAKQAVEVVNSWGNTWGNNGFAWIGYETLKRECQEAWIINLNTNRSFGDESIDFHGHTDILLEQGKTMLMNSSNIETEGTPPDFIGIYDKYISTFETQNAYPEQTKFRFYFKANTNAYVYLFQWDEKVQKIELMVDSVWIEDENKAVLIPPNNESYVLEGDTKADYIAILYSLEPLYFKEKEIPEATGNFMEQIQTLLPNKIINTHRIEWDATKISFKVTTAERTIVPCIIKIKHL
jgi:Papain family cysteine protease